MTPESEAQELKEALEYVDDPERYAKPAWWADRRLDIIAAAYRAESKHSQALRDENERLKGAIIGQDNSATVAALRSELSEREVELAKDDYEVRGRILLAAVEERDEALAKLTAAEKALAEAKADLEKSFRGELGKELRVLRIENTELRENTGYGYLLENLEKFKARAETAEAKLSEATAALSGRTVLSEEEKDATRWGAFLKNMFEHQAGRVPTRDEAVVLVLAALVRRLTNGDEK